MTGAAHLTADQLIEAFNYLDDLRESGRTNMYAAPAYVQRELGWNRDDSLAVTGLWMRTFDRDQDIVARVKKILGAKA